MGSDEQIPQSTSWLQWADPQTSASSSSANTSSQANPYTSETISDEMGRSHWYPLTGPPTNPEESQILRDTISKENEAINSSLRNSQPVSNEELDGAAQLNCADEALTYKVCAYRSWIGNLCMEENNRLLNCMNKQREYLQKLGYLSRKNMSHSEKQSIMDAADDMYLNELSASEKAPTDASA
ncbi:hypothetical protein BASA83_004429 [Batrachochytrium salamandrivorans]|nr:hypothetical protein BASA83_004429 [Batrachochytrium salamandrivorans]